VIARHVVLVGLAACGRLGFHERADAPVTADVPGLSLDATTFADGMIAPPCGTSVLFADDFEDGAPGAELFTYADPGLTLSEPGHLRVDFAATVSPGSYAGYKTLMAYAPEGVCGTVEVLAVPSGEGTMYMKLWAMTEQLEVFEHNNVLEMRTQLGPAVATLHAMVFDPVAHRFWRLRQQGGVTYWDTSPDGVVFVSHVSTTFLTAAMVQFELGAGAFGTVSGAGSARFDNARLTGP
jgi:hypothetical protein